MLFPPALFPIAGIGLTLVGLLMGALSLFLIMLILIQRGRGGGLSGALGGPGGQSAFGSKAGDTFTKITVAVASVWALTCVIATASTQQPRFDLSEPEATIAPGPADAKPQSPIEEQSPIGELSVPAMGVPAEDKPAAEDSGLMPPDNADAVQASDVELSPESPAEVTSEEAMEVK